MQIETMYCGLAQPIVGAGSAVVRATGVEGGRTMQVEVSNSDQ
jgi:hypothetical protein